MVSLVNRTGNGDAGLKENDFHRTDCFIWNTWSGNPIERFWGVKRELNCFQSDTSVFRERSKNNVWLFIGFGFFSFADAK
jgi:hypothetical protein